MRCVNVAGDPVAPTSEECAVVEHGNPHIPLTTEDRIALIEDDLSEIKNTLKFIKETIVSADTTIAKVAGEVMPTINELMQSPMLKMLGVGKKK